MTNQEINQTIVDENNKQMQEIRNEKPEMTLSKALESLNSIQDHHVKMTLIDVMAQLANDQFKKGCRHLRKSGDLEIKNQTIKTRRSRKCLIIWQPRAFRSRWRADRG